MIVLINNISLINLQSCQNLPEYTNFQSQRMSGWLKITSTRWYRWYLVPGGASFSTVRNRELRSTRMALQVDAWNGRVVTMEMDPVNATGRRTGPGGMGRYRSLYGMGIKP